MVRRTGRRPGNPDTRDAILAAARTAFAEKGYDGASIRHIATSAGVDPALVHHYFGTKDKLFLASMNAPLDPGEIIPEVLAGDPEDLGERLVTMFLTIWDGPAGKAGVGLLRSAVSTEWTGRLFREFVVTQVLRRVMQSVPMPPEEAPLRVSLVASQLSGLALVRYVIKVEPLASTPREVLVKAVGPTIQRYIFGDIGKG
ncbi:TetR family transcriptional regulator [Asanoa sp. WMMD1127]|uniref:TetR/AcrR family transcriptional regulator n=1 Tax=Asanoa sp. WMMD1127 TaxID=3016107 RepID=UPI002416A642|nr:TetR family transcriptional regulator [Asanoa sp. WMMD1127]MDG4827032.1 TetR family transcriptional regulator [Asanoa sp. WMMD1127]